MEIRLLGLALILLTSLSTAQNPNSSVSEDPGLVKADSPIYGFDVALDNAFLTAGFTSAGDIAVERASEVAVAEERNNTEAVSKAVDRFNSAAEKADNEDVEKLRQAETVLQNVSNRVPEEAQEGINTALENVRTAKNHVPESLTSNRGSGGVLPDIEMPDMAGDGDLDVPGEDGSRSGER